MTRLIEVSVIKESLIEFTQDIVRIPSFTGEEGRIAKVIYNKLCEIGVDDCWIDEIGNVVGVIKGEGDGPNILLNSHMDVVPPGELAEWKYDPFCATISGEGEIFGRGTADMKGGLAALIYSMKIIIDYVNQRAKLPGNLIFSSVVHEEAAEMFGMEYLCTHSLPKKGLNFDVCLLGEPTGGKLNLGHRGKVEFVLNTYGKSVHSSRPWQGINAIEKMLPILEYIFWKISPTLPTHPLLGKCSITVTNILSKPGALSIIPDVCEISIDRRYLPNESIEDLLAEFYVIINMLENEDPEFRATVNERIFLEKSYTGYTKKVKKHHPVWIIDKDDYFVKRAINSLRRIGQDVNCGYFTGGVDGAYTAGVMKIPTIGFSWADESLAHSSNEFTTIDTLVKDTEGYAAIISDLFGLDLV